MEGLQIEPQWLQDGWLLLSIDSIVFLDHYILIKKAALSDGHQLKYIRNLLIEQNDDLKYDNPLLYKKTSGSDCVLSTFKILDDEVQEIIIRGWKRSRITDVCPEAIRFLEIGVGDVLLVRFEGLYKDGFLQITSIRWVVPYCYFLIDPQKLSQDHQQAPY